VERKQYKGPVWELDLDVQHVASVFLSSVTSRTNLLLYLSPTRNILEKTKVKSCLAEGASLLRLFLFLLEH
jgi:hypothetical protein